MKSLCKKYYVHVILVGLVAVVGGVAAFLYIDQFGANGFSKKTGDWANFATYISGTVGVAAIVATLIAFVITLRQQQKLIDSQDQMLKKQDEQLEFSEKQLIAAEKRNSVERAYLNVKDVLPKLIEAFSLSLDDHFSPPSNSDLERYMLDVYGSERVFTVDEFYKKPHRLLCYSKTHSADLDELKSYVELVLGHSSNVYSFVLKQLDVEEDLFYFVDVQLSESKGAAYQSYWFYIRCLLAYRMGRYGGKAMFRSCSLLRAPIKYNSYSHHSDHRIRDFYILGNQLS